MIFEERMFLSQTLELATDKLKNGGFNGKGRSFEAAVLTFWMCVQKADVDECWLWIGNREKQGYGNLRVLGKTTKAHRFSFLLIRGDIPDGMQVCHRCDNPPCVNPSHLFLGTPQTNQLDCVAKGRATRLKGEDHPGRKLSESNVRFIRESGYASAGLALAHGVDVSTINRIKRGVAWKP